jgi:hypothetical protein
MRPALGHSPVDSRHTQLPSRTFSNANYVTLSKGTQTSLPLIQSLCRCTLSATSNSQTQAAAKAGSPCHCSFELHPPGWLLMKWITYNQDVAQHLTLSGNKHCEMSVRFLGYYGRAVSFVQTETSVIITTVSANLSQGSSVSIVSDYRLHNLVNGV